MSTTTSDITAAQWLDIRDHVAKRVKNHTTSQTQESTTIRIAEGLLREGLIDIPVVITTITPKPAPPKTPAAPAAGRS